MTALLPAFPQDIEREIFEATACSYTCATTLVLVARRVHIWIQPFIYNIIITRLNTTWTEFTEPSIEAVEHYGMHVRHLLIGARADPDVLIHYLSWCPGVTNLAMWNSRVNPSIIPHLVHLPLTRLSAHVDELFGSALKFSEACRQNHPILANLTHLDIPHLSEAWEDWEGLAHLTKLTHLSVPDLASRDVQGVIHGILESCETLRYLALLSERWDGKSGVPFVLSKLENRRLVECAVVSYAADWKAGALGGVDSWSLIEQAVDRRTSRLEVISDGG